MDVNSVASNITATSRTESSEENLIQNKDAFIKIFIAQMQYQNPLEPTDPTALIDSIARISSVEQAITTNDNLETLIELNGGGTEQFGDPISYLDKIVEFESDTIQLKDGGTSFSYEMGESAEQLFIVIRSESGNPVYTGFGSKNIGNNEFAWDGMSTENNPVSDGVYEVEAFYVGKDGEIVNLTTSTVGVVTGADIDDGDITLLVGQLKTLRNHITSIRSENAEENI